MTGIGLSLLSKSVIERDVQHGNLSVLRLKNQTFNRTLSYIYSPVMQDKKNVQTFINAFNKRTASG